MGYLRRVRISGEKCASRGRQEEGMVYRSGLVNVLFKVGVMYSGMCVAVLYCTDGNAVLF